MKMRKVLLFIITIALCWSCEKDDTNIGTTAVPSAHMNNAYVLNEGNWGTNGATLDLIDLGDGSISNDYFAACNGRGLGDVGQDIVCYGNKAYITVTYSNSIEVLDNANGQSTRIGMGTRLPRYMACHNGKLYVTCYNPCSVVRIDTATLQIEATCSLGTFQPEGICVAGDKLCVTSSHIADEDNNYYYDNHLYVVDIASFSVSGTIETGYNPNQVVTLDGQRVAVAYSGDYYLNPGGAAIIDLGDNTQTVLDVAPTKMEYHNGKLYGYEIAYNADYSTSASFFRIDIGTLQKEAILADCGINNPYCINVNPHNGNIYIGTDGNYYANGDLYCFTPQGQRLWKVEAGMFPTKVVVF